MLEGDERVNEVLQKPDSPQAAISKELACTEDSCNIIALLGDSCSRERIHALCRPALLATFRVASVAFPDGSCGIVRVPEDW